MAGVTLYTIDKAIDICEWIAKGKSLNSYCEQENTPALSTIYKWLIEQDQFSKLYTRAREDQADTLADQIIDIADDSEKDFVDAGLGENDNGTPIVKLFNSEHVQRSKLRVEARKWVAAKLKPRKYGDKITQAVEGNLNITVDPIKLLLEQVEGTALKPSDKNVV